jgi:hypothetical protein
MRELVLGLLGATALAFGSASASALVVTNDIDGTLLEGFGSEFFGAARDAAEGTGAFSDAFNFVLSQDWVSNAQVGSIILQGRDVDFTSVLLDGNAFVQTQFDPDSEVWDLAAIGLGSGPHTLTVNGTISGPGGGSYAGTINVAAPVPEPATWGMMLLGFGVAGFALRRSRRPRTELAQLA